MPITVQHSPAFGKVSDLALEVGAGQAVKAEQQAARQEREKQMELMQKLQEAEAKRAQAKELIQLNTQMKRDMIDYQADADREKLDWAQQREMDLIDRNIQEVMLNKEGRFSPEQQEFAIEQLYARKHKIKPRTRADRPQPVEEMMEKGVYQNPDGSYFYVSGGELKYQAGPKGKEFDRAKFSERVMTRMLENKMSLKDAIEAEKEIYLATYKLEKEIAKLRKLDEAGEILDDDNANPGEKKTAAKDALKAFDALPEEEKKVVEELVTLINKGDREGVNKLREKIPPDKLELIKSLVALQAGGEMSEEDLELEDPTVSGMRKGAIREGKNRAAGGFKGSQQARVDFLRGQYSNEY